MRSAAVLAVLLAGCGAGDPCGAPTGEPSLELGGARIAGGPFEPFEPGSPRQLVLGPQGGMHVFLHARIGGLCPETTVLERRVVDDADPTRVYQVGRGPVDFVEAEEPGIFALEDPVAIILCPEPSGFPVAGQTLRFVASAIDGEDRRADAQIAFVAACPDGLDCEAICAP